MQDAPATATPAKGIATDKHAPARATAKSPAKMPAKAPDDGREYTTVLEEDFSLVTEGSEYAPIEEYIENSYDIIPSNYTHTPGWGGRGIMQAGGAICVGKVTDYTGAEMTGQIETPELDLHRDNGTAYVSFRARSFVPEVDVLNVRWIADDDLFGTSGDTQTVYISGSLWQSYEVELDDCPENAVIQFYTDSYEFLIDDIKVEQFHPIIDAPTALKWTNFTGDSFTANWTEVEGADHYILNVYYVRREGTEDELPDYKFVVKNREVQGTSYDVTGLNPEKTYFYYVRAVNADGEISEESSVVEVLALTIPTGVVISDVSQYGFQVEWDPVLHAEGYAFEAYLSHTAQEDEEYALLDESFDGITSEGSIGDPYVNPVGYYDMDSYGMSRANWVMYEGGVIDGAIALHNYVSTYGEQYYGELVSPYLTIKNTTGQITIEADYASLDGVHPYMQIAVPGVVDGVTTWVLGAGGEINETVNSEWTHISKTYNVNPGLIRISVGCSDGGWLYIDNLRITVELPKDAVQSLPYKYDEITEDLDAPQYYCYTDDRERGDEYSFALDAVRVNPHSGWIVYYVYSGWTDSYDVPSIEWSGVGRLAADDAATLKVAGRQGEIAISNPEGLTVRVYDLAGRLVGQSATEAINLPVSRGIYVVSSADGLSQKVAVK
jgi:hypothetical protein